MKKLSIFLCLLFLSLMGCGGSKSNTSDAPKIEDYSWQMTTVQSVENEGQAVAHVPNMEGMPDTALEITLGCIVLDGTITLANETNGQTYTGAYKLTDTSHETSIYELTVGDIEGMAVVSMTTYHDENETPTLIISLGDYTLNFFPTPK